MRPVQLLAAAVAFSSVSAAWPDVFGEVKAVQRAHAFLYGRQDNQNTDSPKPTDTDAPKSTNNAKPSSGPAASTTGDSPKETASDAKSATATDKDAKTTAKTATDKATATPSKARNATTKIPPNAAAGGIQMITPGIFDPPQYYKIGDWVEFAWNYTSLSVTPTAIDVLVSCSANQGTYTIAVNQSVEETGRVFWDTGAFQATATQPLLDSTYTLIVYDADSSISARPKPGYFGPDSSFRFAMYTPQNYVPWAEFKCPGCNGALSTHEITFLKLFSYTGSMMLLSVLIFTQRFGLW